MELVLRRKAPRRGVFADLARGILRAAARLMTALAVEFLPKTVKQASAADRLAEHFLKAHGNAILRLAYSYVHCYDEAEDVLQETLIRVIEANPRFENEAHEKAYLLKTASNVAKNHIASIKRHAADELNEELVSEEREDLSFVWEAVKGLPETSREVIHLFYAEGYQTAEIAKILNRNESTVRSDLKRARERLKEILKEEYDFG